MFVQCVIENYFIIHLKAGELLINRQNNNDFFGHMVANLWNPSLLRSIAPDFDEKQRWIYNGPLNVLTIGEKSRLRRKPIWIDKEPLQMWYLFAMA